MKESGQLDIGEAAFLSIVMRNGKMYFPMLVDVVACFACIFLLGLLMLNQL